MVAKAVAADNDRVCVATIATDAGTWGNDGGGGGVADEPDFFYQSATAQSRKVSTTRIGRNYTDGGTPGSRDASTGSGTHQHFLFKVNVTNYAALLARTTPAAGLKIGSTSANYDEWYVLGNDNYPTAGGWQFIVINPNVTGYVDDATNGTPDLTALTFYSFLADFSAGSKGENLVIDAIDLGRGLKLTGGDGADPDALWSDFLLADEGTAANRWGYIRSLSGIYYVQGELAIGENTSETAVATVFQDTSGQVLVWENGRAATGYYKFRVNLGNATTDIDITGSTFDSIGEKANTVNGEYTATGEDTRLYVEATGTTGDAKFIGCFFKNLSDMTLTTACTLDTCDVETETFDDGAGAEIFDSIIRTTSAANVATYTDPTLGVTTNLRDTEFVETGAGHAIEFTTTTPRTLSGITFTGYGGTPGSNLVAASGATNAAILNSSGGALTINVSGGGNSPSVRNTASSTTTIVNTKTLTVTVKDKFGVGVDSARVSIRDASDNSEISQGTASAGGVYTDGAYAYTSDTAVRVLARKSSTGTRYIPAVATGTITTNGLDVTLTLIVDPIA
jgi:hypothetical protein